MIYEVSGDILKSKAKAIAHGIAPNDHFNQGLALNLKEMWPSLYKDFRHYCQAQKAESGDLWAWAGSNGQQIINLFTQEAPKDHNSNPGKATLSNLNSSLKELKKFVEKNKINSVAITKIATGVGGLDWADVFPLIKKHLGELDVPVYVYSNYKKDVQAQEPTN